MDFLMVATRCPRGGGIEVYPKFIVSKSNDLMIRGGAFYAIWDEEKRLWSTDEYDAVRLIDAELDQFVKDNYPNTPGIRVLHLWDSETRMIDRFHTFCQRDMRDSFHMLDEKLIFANTDVKKRDYASKKLPYPLEDGECPSYDKLMSTLYDPEERHKLEWAIGAIVSGDSKTIQKFEVLYGPAGSGKSTVINIIQQLFEGYYAVFDAKALGSANAAFALESFKTNPLVAIQHDGDLSRIEDNTRLNSVVSHEIMTVNEKFKSAYSSKFKAFLFMGTNKPVKITDAKSGLIRRLIDVSPSGRKVPTREYNQLVKQVEFELGAIATRCLNVYMESPGYYDGYVPTSMLDESNDFYNFVADSYFIFKKEPSTSLKQAWEMYKTYCEEAKMQFLLNKRNFKSEMKNYFEEYYDRTAPEGKEPFTFYGFKIEKFDSITTAEKPEKKKKNAEPDESWLKFREQPSIFDMECKDCFAQYASDNETPMKKWSDVRVTLKDVDTHRLHYVKVPIHHIVIDFDIPDQDGKKCFEKNLEAASKWPQTYAELSKSGAGIHLHYIYTGDPEKLSAVYEDHVEIKVFSGLSSLRRKLTKCNNLPIASLSSGLPLKGDGKVINFEGVKSEKELRTKIRRNLNKEYHAATKPSVDFIYKILEDAYNSGLHYDVTDMRNAVLAFAANSTNQANYCIKLVNKMRFKSEEPSKPGEDGDQPIVFYDVEVFPNLFLVNWKVQGAGKQVVRMINPKPKEIEELIKFKLVGFNCRRYDNHILYARMIGYSNEQLYTLSQRIISGSPNAMFGEAYNISYTDVYDYCAKKQSLKKWEIELGIHHQELGLPWDKPVPEELWPKVAEYCDNDVLATEAVWDHTQGDFAARKILAQIAKMTVNDTTNQLTTRIIFGTNKHPQDAFNYRDMGDVSQVYDEFADVPFVMEKEFDDFTVFDKQGRPIFPGYKYKNGKSSYRDVDDVGEGGRVSAKPGMYGFIALLDIASMHPSSAIAEMIFGEVYTQRFKDLKDARVAIKHEDWDTGRVILGGALAPFIDQLVAGTADFTKDDLTQALKIAINSVYGLTAANFDNPFHDPRNKDNIVAKRGALFMINLEHEVEKRGYTVAHIKTDSIKIPDADLHIIEFVQRYGKMYGYDFEHEATYERMCLVNNAVYIARYATVEQCCELYGEDYVMSKKDICKDNKKHPGQWTATGTQFAVPYVFKTLFTHEDIVFEDMCETKSVQTALYLDFNENLPDVSQYELVRSLRFKDPEKLTRSEQRLLDEFASLTDEMLREKIAEGHNYQFVGRVGQFTPIKDGAGGAILLREDANKMKKTGEQEFASATGADGYRWMESEMVKVNHKEADIDRTYYDYLVSNARYEIAQYGDVEWFVSDDPYTPERIHPWETAEDDAKIFAVR